MIKVLVSGYLGFDNSGDESILKAITSSIRRDRCDLELTVFSSNPERTSSNHGIESVYSFNLIKIIKAVKKCDILISGGGNLLQDKTSSHSLWYYVFIIMLAKLFKKKVMLYANGVGPLTKKFNKYLVKKVINKVDFITIRETLNPSDDEVIDKIFEQEGIRLNDFNVGISVRKWKTEDEMKKFGQLCDGLIDKLGANIVLIPMQYPSDLIVCEQITKYINHPISIIKQRYSSTEQIGIVGKMDLVISMRLHTLIYASLTGTPMLGIIYDEKIKHFLSRINMPYVENIMELDIEIMVSEVMNIKNNLVNLSKGLIEDAKHLKEDALKNNEFLYNLIDGRGCNNGEKN
ncbi:MAG: csaB [Clostridiales bacterium]|nr:csaB [Clostridiales bacterium]